ncbi:hypothetical protein BZA77DRAFT_320190 [Pyronema omphalodes]|nr:hypothetical protein BZA77DRAFT_320190 [Pyronema omphalodes]
MMGFSFFISAFQHLSLVFGGAWRICVCGGSRRVVFTSPEPVLSRRLSPRPFIRLYVLVLDTNPRIFVAKISYAATN